MPTLRPRRFGGHGSAAVKLADLFAIGPIGNLVQLIDAGAAVYLYFQARSLVIVVSLIFGFLRFSVAPVSLVR